ncbi:MULTISPECIES: hypothetical protein [Streptomyces]|uniref:hypothetical protein n=1 Tax=Streptomyces TaxID=1883 RepID=UPI00345BCC98
MPRQPKIISRRFLGSPWPDPEVGRGDAGCQESRGQRRSVRVERFETFEFWNGLSDAIDPLGRPASLGQPFRDLSCLPEANCWTRRPGTL